MSKQWFKEIATDGYKYELTQTVSYRIPALSIPSTHFYSKKGFLVARNYQAKLTLMPGYRWDGCTGIGNIIETRQTLIASLLHDFLYQLSEQSAWTPPFTQRQADIEFRRLLPCWAKPLYYLGVRSAGWAFWGDKQDTLIIKEYE